MGYDYQNTGGQDYSNVIGQYAQYVPTLNATTASTIPTTAQAELTAANRTAGTSGLGYNALNTEQMGQYGSQLASNTLSAQRAGNPDYYTAQDAASNASNNLINSISLTGLSPGEYNSTERALNQSNTATGNAGLINPTNTISNAMNFGGAYNTKLNTLSNAITSATNAANSASTPGFGTSNFVSYNPNTMSNTANTAYGFGNTTLSDLLSANTAANSTAGSEANAQASAISSIYGSGAGGNTCCFIFMEAYNGIMPSFVRKSRNRYYNLIPSVAVGYVKMAKWLVPLMQKYSIVRDLVWKFMVLPLTQYGGFTHRVKGYENFRSKRIYRKFWFALWSIN